MEKVTLYDTTLRDGMQGPGMSLSAPEKVRVVRALDEIGIDLIEAGFPSSNPKEVELFELLSEVELDHAEICAFGMTRRRDTAPEDDPALEILTSCFAPVVTLVGKTWGLHLEKVTRVGREENVAMISDSVGFCRARGKRVVYDAEHFFDAFRDDRGYAIECLDAAVAGGAETVTLCDTNGSSLPAQIADATSQVYERFGSEVEIGIHTHNDLECGVANALAAVDAGARHVQGTFNGYGERCGNANLVSILPSLQLKMGFSCVGEEQLAQLTETSHFIAELCNVPPHPSQAYVGRYAFAHKGGMHVAGVAADASTFEHINPAVVGNSREVLASELSGRATVRARASDIGVEFDEGAATRALEELKRREHLGYHYEAADASFELLLRRAGGSYRELFRLERFRVTTEKREDGQVMTEATIKITVDGETYHRAAEGNGPVNALDRALRSAIGMHYPELADLELTNYKVRILDENHGTDAVTRVLLDTTDGEKEWGTIGVSENIIEASWEALVESLEYAINARSLEERAGGPTVAGDAHDRGGGS